MQKILVADDERFVLDVCKRVLEFHGFVPIITADGLEALEHYERFQSDIVLIISDLSMPRMDGITFVREVFGRNPKSNVILMTGYTPNLEVPKDLQRICGLLAKPFTAAQLMHAVKKCLEYQAQHPD